MVYVSDWDEDELRNEFSSRRAPYKCPDGMCGALDCARCYPGAAERQDGEFDGEGEEDGVDQD